jgi:hypothetical protein
MNHPGFIEIMHKGRGVSPEIIVALNIYVKIRGVALIS